MAAPDLPRDYTLIDTIKGLRKPHKRTDDGWVTVGAPGSFGTDEISPPFENSWDNVSGGTMCKFFMDDNGVVRIKGDIEGGGSGTTVFTLPADYCPEDTLKFPGTSIDGVTGDLTVFVVVVLKTGEVKMYYTTFTP